MLANSRTCLAAISALILLGTAGVARAESASNLGVLTIDPNHAAIQPIHRSLQWDQKGRWGLKLDMNEPAGRVMQLRDVQAGAYYRVTPSLRVGGAVSFSDQPAQLDRSPLPTTQAPQVKLETTFKF
jgi:hypothetical protein